MGGWRSPLHAQLEALPVLPVTVLPVTSHSNCERMSENDPGHPFSSL